MEMDRTMNAIVMVLYNLTVLAGTSYLVINYDWSAWWFLFALCVLMGNTRENKNCQCQCKYEPPKKDEKKIIVP
jgi:hypothetical protein